jgi:hypothetical protein
MTDWMALAAEFLNKGARQGDQCEISDSVEGAKQGDSQVLTKLTNPFHVENATAAVELDQEFILPYELTKPPKPSSEGVVSVSSVKFVHDEFDDRVLCTDCHNYRYGHCHQHIRAGIGNSSQVGSDLASLPQRCPAFEPKR